MSLGEPLGMVDQDLQIWDKNHKHKKLPRQHLPPSSHFFHSFILLYPPLVGKSKEEDAAAQANVSEDKTQARGDSGRW